MEYIQKYMEESCTIKEDSIELPCCNTFIAYESKTNLEFNYVSVIKQSLQEVLNTMACPKADKFEFSIKLVDEEEIQTLNKEYRDKDKPTNVLSFEYDLEDEPNFDEEFTYIGDIAVCVPVVIGQALEQNKKTEDHFAHLVVHSILHLFGFEHIDDNEAEIMESLEIQILKKMQIANPYIIQGE
jgi:probable rRNA maturation factor